MSRYRLKLVKRLLDESKVQLCLVDALTWVDVFLEKHGMKNTALFKCVDKCWREATKLSIDQLKVSQNLQPL